MKKWLERLKDALYGALPWILLFGIPMAIGIVVWVIFNWDDIPKILSHIADLGNGSLFYGIVLLLFGLIGLTNAAIAFMMWCKAFVELLEKKAKSYFIFWLAIIAVSLGWFSLVKIVINILL